MRRYLNMGEQMNSAIQQYVKDVRSRDFPNADEQYEHGRSPGRLESLPLGSAAEGAHRNEHH